MPAGPGRGEPSGPRAPSGRPPPIGGPKPRPGPPGGGPSPKPRRPPLAPRSPPRGGGASPRRRSGSRGSASRRGSSLRGSSRRASSRPASSRRGSSRRASSRRGSSRRSASSSRRSPRSCATNWSVSLLQTGRTSPGAGACAAAMLAPGRIANRPPTAVNNPPVLNALVLHPTLNRFMVHHAFRCLLKPPTSPKVSRRRHSKHIRRSAELHSAQGRGRVLWLTGFAGTLQSMRYTKCLKSAAQVAALREAPYLCTVPQRVYA
jgi:hypothetical protein